MRLLTGEPLSYTFALIKPDAVLANRAPDILDEMSKLFIVADVMVSKWSPEAVENFYAEHAEKSFFPDLVRFMSSAPMYAVTLVGPDVSSCWRREMGATDPRKADRNSIRYRYAAHDGVIMHNCVHGSDNLMKADEEIDMAQFQLGRRFGEVKEWALRHYAGVRYSTLTAELVWP